MFVISFLFFNFLSAELSKDEETTSILLGLLYCESGEDYQGCDHEAQDDKNEKWTLVGSFDISGNGWRHKKRTKQCEYTEVDEFFKFKHTC